MKKKTIITALLVLVSMAGHSQVHYRLEGFVGDSNVTGKAYILDMSLLHGEIIDSVNNTLCEDLTSFYKTEQKVIGDWQRSRLENNPNPGPSTLADMGPEYTERREKAAVNIVNRHTSDILGYYLLHEVATNYMSSAKWLELFDKMEPWLKRKPALYSYLSKFKSVKEKNLKK